MARYQQQCGDRQRRDSGPGKDTAEWYEISSQGLGEYVI